MLHSRIRQTERDMQREEEGFRTINFLLLYGQWMSTAAAATVVDTSADPAAAAVNGILLRNHGQQRQRQHIGGSVLPHNYEELCKLMEIPSASTFLRLQIKFGSNAAISH